MGYYTNFNITWEPVDDRDHVEGIGVINKYGNASSFDDNYCVYAKWYGYNEDMIKYSKLHPDVVFTVEGEGEESGDLWRAYYENGEVWETRPDIEFKSYNELKNGVPDKVAAEPVKLLTYITGNCIGFYTMKFEPVYDITNKEVLSEICDGYDSVEIMIEELIKKDGEDGTQAYKIVEALKINGKYYITF